MDSFNQLLIELYFHQENHLGGCPTPHKLYLLIDLLFLYFISHSLISKCILKMQILK